MCQDPRDKIYGLLAISSLIFRDQIVVDYRYNIGQVYQMASELASEDKEKRTLPSWIPDFSRYASDLKFEVLDSSHLELTLIGTSKVSVED